MNPRIAFFSASLALLAVGGQSYATSKSVSLGTSKCRTAGGSNLVKFSVINQNSIPAAREVAAAINRTGVRALLASGGSVVLPSQLEGEEQIRPWKPEEQHVLQVKTGTAIVARLTKLMERSQHLHDKGEITDQQNNTVHGLQSYVDYFNQTSTVLQQHKVAVLLDE